MSKRKVQTEKKNLSMERALIIIRSPLVTEKSTNIAQKNQYGFKTTLDATKPEIKSAIEQIFNVQVESVNTLLQKGKVKRFKGKEGQRSSFKKAYVKLAEGFSIDIGAGI